MEEYYEKASLRAPGSGHASVEEICDSAFNGCQKLETVYYGGTASDWDEIEIARYNKRLTSAELVFSDAETPAPASSGKPSAGSKLK